MLEERRVSYQPSSTLPLHCPLSLTLPSPPSPSLTSSSPFAYPVPAPSPPQEPQAEALTSLLATLAASGVVNQTQMTKGFSRIRARLDEETLDYGPRARDIYGAMVQKAVAAGWLSLDPEA